MRVLYQVHVAIKPWACIATGAGTTPSTSVQLELAAVALQDSPLSLAQDPGVGLPRDTPLGAEVLLPDSCCCVSPTCALLGSLLLDEAFASDRGKEFFFAS